MNNDLSEFSCMITKGSSKTKLDPEDGFCSGTFISNRIFVTAAHCFQREPQWMGKLEEQKENLYISCPGDFTFQVKGTIPQKSFYSSDAFNSFGEFQGTSFPNRENDIAVLVTEESTFSSFPRLSKSEDSLSNCSLLGYSSYKCDRSDGANCYRHIRFVSDEILKGKLFDTVDEKLIYQGDSGSGIICMNSEEQTIMGILVSSARNKQIVNIKYHKNFLEELLRMSSDQLLARASTFRSSKDFLRYNELYLAQLRDSNPSTVRINCTDGVKCLKYFELNEELKRKGIHEKLIMVGIRNIMVQIDNQKIKKPKSTILPDTILIGPKTEVSDIESMKGL
jgi:V8-like Glu-specific endopeptidase